MGVYEVKRVQDRLMFVQTLDDCVVEGELTPNAPNGQWLVAELKVAKYLPRSYVEPTSFIERGRLFGEIRLRRVGSGILSNFRTSSEHAWGLSPEVLATEAGDLQKRELGETLRSMLQATSSLAFQDDNGWVAP